jgi:hypothetical protein
VPAAEVSALVVALVNGASWSDKTSKYPAQTAQADGDK